MSRDWDALYDLQNRVIARMNTIKHEFYLTGGTALSRGYYHHRYSEDLDFFINDSPSFELLRDRCIFLLEQVSDEECWRVERQLTDKRFGRAFIHGSEVLKLEFINDVPFRVGMPQPHPVFNLLDTRENILANKITALVDRKEPKDVADIYWLCCEDKLNLLEALAGASKKTAGIFPLYVASELDKWRKAGVPDALWLKRPEPARYEEGLARLIETLSL